MRYVDLGTGVDPVGALALQDRIHANVVAGAEDTFMVYEPRACYTAGTEATWQELAAVDAVVVPIDRPGHIGWLAPGMLVSSAIVAVPDGMHGRDWLQVLRDATAKTLTEFGVAVTCHINQRSLCAVSTDGLAATVASISVDCIDGVTMHGVSINVSADTSQCIADMRRLLTRRLTSMQAVLGYRPSVESVAQALRLNIAGATRALSLAA